MQSEDKYKKAKNTSPFFRIDEDILMIFQGKTSIDYNSCNSYLIKDKNNVTIVDPGTSRLKLKQALKLMDVEIQNIKNVILTHAHSDHYVLIDFLRKKACPEVYIHHKDREFLENTGKYVSFLFDMEFFKKRPKFREFQQVLKYFSNPEEFKIEEGRINLNPAIKSVFDTWKIYNITPDHEYKHSETLPSNLEAIHLPGHSPGHCGLLSKEKSIVFCADIDFNKRGPTVSSPFANIHDYKQSINSLNRIISKFKIRYLFPGHWNPIFSNLKVHLLKFGREFNKKENGILRILAAEKDFTIDEISEKTFSEFSKNFDEFLNDSNRDSLLVAEASDLMTNKNYLNELKRLKKVSSTFINAEEYWRLI